MTEKQEIEQIVHSAHADPFAVLGAHVVRTSNKKLVAIRAFLPDAAKVAVIDLETDKQYPMKKLHQDGFFEASVEGKTQIFPYRLKKTDESGETIVLVDPYSFMPVLSDFDLQLIAEGTHKDQYEKLGAHGADTQRRGGRSLCRMGAKRHQDECRRGLQPMGWTKTHDARPRIDRCVGDIHPRSSSRRDLQA